MPSVSVLIPVYNNATTLHELHQRLGVVLETVTDEFEIIFVDDGSSDDSLGIIRQMAKDDPHVVGLALSRNFGQHPAISAGLERACGDLTVLMDADLQDRPEELPRLLEPFDSDPDIDIVYTTFEMESGQKSRVTSRLFWAVYSRLTDLHLPPNLGTYRAFTAAVREALLTYPERGAVYGPLMSQMGYQQQFVKVARAEAVGRKTSYTFRRRLSLAISSMISYGKFLHRFVTWVGLVLTALSVAYLAVLVIQYLTGFRELVNGQLLLLGITVLMSGVLLMTVGVLSAYTYRIFQEVLARPRYHIARSYGQGLKRSVDP
jgi:glycosyltransferase involved in cell wall biosynthesis